MPRTDTYDRLARLDLLASRLKADELLTAGAVAAELGVSIRTLFRDLDVLRERGLPVEADRGRGGGLRLNRKWGIGRLHLDYREAIGLLVSLAIAEQLPSPWHFANLAVIRRKLAGSFSPALQSRIARLRSRIFVGQSASARVLEALSPARGRSIDKLFQAFIETRLLAFGYSDTAGRVTQRIVEPQLLLLNYPVWYLIGWDSRRNAVRSFRCDRMSAASVAPETFRLRPAATFAAAIEGIGAVNA